MISELLQKHMLKRRHEGHFMIEKSKRRVRDILHWPQTNSNIEELSRLVVYAKNTGVVKQNPMLVAEENFPPGVEICLHWLEKKDYVFVLNY